MYRSRRVGFWSLLGGLSEKRLPAFWLSVLHLFRTSLSGIRSLGMCVFLCMIYMHMCTYCMCNIMLIPSLMSANYVPHCLVSTRIIFFYADLQTPNWNLLVNKRHTSLLINSQMYFSSHLKGTGKAKKDEHEVE